MSEKYIYRFLKCGRRWQIILLLLITYHSSPITSYAQQEAVAEGNAEQDSIEVQARIQTMVDNLRQIYAVTQMMPSAGYEGKVKLTVAKVMADRLKVANRALNQLDFKWNAYFQAIQVDIAENDDLMALAAEFQQMEESVKDSIDSMTGKINLLMAFCEAEVAIPAHDQQYRQLFNEAMELSMVAKLAPLLEKLKGREAVMFADIETHYAKAKEATTAMPRLQKRMEVIDQHYIVLKNTSEKIQAAAYKPFIQRAKDWLLGLAAVAILIMFLNMVVTKIQAIKKTRENMKKMKELMNGGNNQFYPTI